MRFIMAAFQIAIAAHSILRSLFRSFALSLSFCLSLSLSVQRPAAVPHCSGYSVALFVPGVSTVGWQALTAGPDTHMAAAYSVGRHHKDDAADRPWLLRLYYSKAILFFCVAGDQIFFCAL